MPLRQLCLTLGWRAIEAAELPFGTIQADEWTAAIIKTHNYGRDFATLRTLLPLNLRYVGLIGPRARRDQLMNDLLDAGVTINAGFYSPAGIDLGGEIPEQIALELVSEIQRVFAGGSGASLRERRARIHAASSSQPGSSPGVAPPQPGSLDSTDLIGRV
jgi:xanthine/CO dehydrogenase XdhC/CoxF family maturation factor